jgi:hypothetical protein
MLRNCSYTSSFLGANALLNTFYQTLNHVLSLKWGTTFRYQ